MVSVWLLILCARTTDEKLVKLNYSGPPSSVVIPLWCARAYVWLRLEKSHVIPSPPLVILIFHFPSGPQLSNTYIRTLSSSYFLRVWLTSVLIRATVTPLGATGGEHQQPEPRPESSARPPSEPLTPRLRLTPEFRPRSATASASTSTSLSPLPRPQPRPWPLCPPVFRRGQALPVPS